MPERSFCYSLKAEDAHAAKLCELMQGRGVARELIDTGLSARIFRPPADSLVPDGTIEPAEVYALAIEIIEDEYFRSGETTFEEEQGSFAIKAWEAGFRLPWIVYDGNPYTKSDVETRDELSRMARSVRGESELELARAIYDTAFSKEGLGMEVWNSFPVEYNAEYALKFRWGDCTEISWVLYSLYKYAGFDPRFVWVREEFDGSPLLHMAVAVWADGREVIADSHFGFDADHRVVVDLPPLAALASYVNNVAVGQQDKVDAAGMLGRSLGYDPTYSLTYLYMAGDRMSDMFQMDRDECVEKAAGLDPAAREYMDLLLKSGD